MARKKTRSKKGGARAASAQPAVTRMSRAPSVQARVSTVPPPPDATAATKVRDSGPVRSVSPWASSASTTTTTSTKPQTATSWRPPDQAPVLQEPKLGQFDEQAPVQAVDHGRLRWSDPPPTGPSGRTSERAPASAVSDATPYFEIPRAGRVPEVDDSGQLRPRARSDRPPARSDRPPAQSDRPPAVAGGSQRSGAVQPGQSDHSDLADHDHFFATVPPRASVHETAWEDHDEPAPPLAQNTRRAMMTTFWILGVSAVLIGGFVIYNQIVMPTPVRLGARGAAFQLPTPIAASDEPVPAEPPRPVVAVESPQVLPPPAAELVPQPVDVTPHEQPVAPLADPVATAPVQTEAPVEASGPAPTPATGAAEPQIDAMRSYRELLEQANIFYRQGKRQRALEAYDLAIAVNPEGDEALSKVAYHYLNLGKNTQARDFAQRAVAANPKSSEGWIVLGAARDSLRDREGALEAYRQCATVGEGSFVAECKRLAR